MIKIKEKIVIVTGGSGLIGCEIINHLKENGAHVINADINVDDNINNGRLNCDITSDISIKKTVEKVMSHYGKIDG